MSAEAKALAEIEAKLRQSSSDELEDQDTTASDSGSNTEDDDTPGAPPVTFALPAGLKMLPDEARPSRGARRASAASVEALSFVMQQAKAAVDGRRRNDPGTLLPATLCCL